MFGNKGQLFLIVTFLFIIFFSTISFYAFDESILMKKRESLEYFIISSYFENLKGEQEKIFIYFYSNQEMKNFLRNFTIFAREKLEVKDMYLKKIFLLAEYSEIKENISSNLNVSLLNLAGKEISSINITFTYDNSSRFLSFLSDSSFFETSFSFNISNDSNYKLILEYFDEEKEKHEIEIPLRIGKSKKIGFFVLSFIVEKFFMKENFSLII